MTQVVSQNRDIPNSLLINKFMTALTKEQIPNQINTVERLMAWAGLALGFINPTKAIVEAAGENPEKVIQSFCITR